MHSNRKRDDAHNVIKGVRAGRVIVMVGVAGFEPTAFRSQSGRATKLRHTPSVRHVGYMDGDAAAPPDFGVCTKPSRTATMLFVPRSS
ncbi:hypothetical protein SVEN_2405 [Streptomyces venezuelae ATCC 10712]|uniref:Uncharacterized protein n=1 Tax=Streptomyces venezuelae (strain ATCC 10712 / CBS 650.69 / DSM 40230 / JCM 4526 / NBRC 13096 / PD 04745) TaxID=953739 RepID=F2R2E2_STRVP|nr:hypothetical protein SVEN_2405 [Streptomyces venezuelae ATCC 10712]